MIGFPGTNNPTHWELVQITRPHVGSFTTIMPFTPILYCLLVQQTKRKPYRLVDSLSRGSNNDMYTRYNPVVYLSGRSYPRLPTWYVRVRNTRSRFTTWTCVIIRCLRPPHGVTALPLWPKCKTYCCSLHVAEALEMTVIDDSAPAYIT